MISLTGTRVTLKMQHGTLKEGTVLDGLAYDDTNNRFVCILPSEGSLHNIDSRYGRIEMAQTEQRTGDTTPTTVDETISEGQMSWLKGQIKAINKRLEVVENGNNTVTDSQSAV